jgi:hypothetical protein
MNCLPFEERIAEYLDGALDRAEVRVVEEHLRVCPACAQFADRLEYDRILLRTPPPETAEVDFAAMRSQLRRAIVQQRRPTRLAPALLIAASILMAVGIAAIRLGPARVQVGQALPPATATSFTRGADPLVRTGPPGPAVANGINIRPNAKRSTRALPGGGTPADQGARPTTAPVPQADPALEAALREFVAAEKAPAVSPEAASPIEIRIVTGDPNVVLILLQETSGVSNE